MTVSNLSHLTGKAPIYRGFFIFSGFNNQTIHKPELFINFSR